MPKVAGVIVTFNRPESLKRCLESMMGQSTPPEHIFVIDNSPGSGTREMLKTSFLSVIYKHFPENIGSEGGYCEGIRMAHIDYDYVWLMDDDCVSEITALEEMLKWAGQLGEKEKIGAVRSARAGDTERGSPILEIEDLFAWRGTLISSGAVKNVGLPLSDLFLYAGDIEYGLRMRNAGYKLYMVFSSRIESLEYTEKIEGDYGVKRAGSYRQPFRIYYAYRNERWVYKKYGMAKMTRRLIIHSFKSLALFAVRGMFKQAIAVIDGMLDGSLGRLGKNSKYDPKG